MRALLGRMCKLVLVGAVAMSSGCGEPFSPEEAMTGTWSLVSYNGNGLPVSLGDGTSIRSLTITLADDFTYESVGRIGLGDGSVETLNSSGGWELIGEDHVRFDGGDALGYRSENQLTVTDDDDNVLLFQK